MRPVLADRHAEVMDTTSDLRRLVLGLTIGSFSIAALLGVIALLGGGGFGETQGRVLLTTLTVGVACVAMLCCLGTDGTPYARLGVVGGIAVLWPTAQSLMLIWGYDDNTFDNDSFYQVYGLGIVVAFTLAQACLLLATAGNVGRVRGLLRFTLVVAAALAVIACGEIAAEDGSWWRVMGVLGILDVLGTVVTVAMAKFGRDRHQSETARTIVVPADVADALRARAQSEGRSVDAVLRDAVLGSERGLA